MSVIIKLIICLFVTISSYNVFALEQFDCPVCFSIVDKLDKQVKKAGSLTEESYSEAFLELCSHPTKTEKSFCYYMGGDEHSATRTYREMTKQLSQGFPVAKICDYLNSKDSQICRLREKQTVKLKDLDLNSLKPSQLKKILNDKGDPCKGCVEKSEFISRLNKIRETEEEIHAEL